MMKFDMKLLLYYTYNYKKKIHITVLILYFVDYRIIHITISVCNFYFNSNTISFFKREKRKRKNYPSLHPKRHISS